MAGRVSRRRAEGVRIRPKLSIIVCTHNRPDDVAACLVALAAQQRPEAEIIVIDSASAPPARARLQALLAGMPQVRARFLAEPGLSRARNTAVAMSAGDWLALLDDDAVAAPDWLDQVLALIGRLPERAGVVGLRTEPIWPDGTQPELPALWRTYLSVVERDGEGERTHDPQFVGANMLFRRQVVIEAGGFPDRLSRIGPLLLSGEDVYVAERARANGWSIWYSDRPRAGHRIARARLRPAWFRRRLFWQGVTHTRLSRMLDGRLPLYPLARALAAAPVLALMSLAEPAPGTRLARAFWHLGIIAAFVLPHRLVQRRATAHANRLAGVTSTLSNGKSDTGIRQETPG